MKKTIAGLESSKYEVHGSEMHYRQLVENMGDVIFTLDREGNFTFISSQAKEVLNYLPENMIGRNIRKFLVSDSLSVFEENHERQLQGEVLHPYEIGFTSGNGRHVPIEINTSLLFDTEGQLIGIEGIARDMTEHKRLENELLQVHKMEVLGTLVGGVAHDFNNILQTISGLTEILITGKIENDPDFKKLAQIKGQALRASKLTRQLLAFSRKAESQFQPLDLNSEVGKLKEIITRTIPKMIDIEFHLSEKLRFVKADPNQMEQIIMNLIINARDAMSNAGKLVLQTENVTLDEEYCRDHPGDLAGEYVLLTISDTGVGMDRGTLEHIFEPFFTTKEVGKGTGLGLSMVYGIVKNHNGYIYCYSKPGEGTTFKIYLPVPEVEDRIQKAEEREEEEIIGGHETILLVDDEESIIQLGKEVFERYGYNVTTAENGEEAIKIVRKAHTSLPDLVILDLNMPGMGGLRCLQRLLKIEPGINVIIATGYLAELQEDKIREIGARGFIAKPYPMKELLKTVREVLDDTSNPAQQLNYSTN